MKPLVLALLLATSLSVSAQGRVRVPDADTAIVIARRAAVKVYGKARIQRQEPLTAWLDDGAWFVRGTLWCDDPEHKGERSEDPCLALSCVGTS